MINLTNMRQKDFNKAAGGLFFVIGLAHLIRTVYGWPVVVSETAIPLWASWIAVVVAGYLAWSAFKLK